LLHRLFTQGHSQLVERLGLAKAEVGGIGHSRLPRRLPGHGFFVDQPPSLSWRMKVALAELLWIHLLWW
jgi:hypothetical protein